MRPLVARVQQDTATAATAANTATTAALARERQQACVARIGHMALRPGTLDDFFATVCAEATVAFGADACSLVECVPGDDEAVRFRAGVGYPKGFAPRIPAGPGTHARFILRSGAPVLYADLAGETRFQPAPHLLGSGVRGGMSVPILTSAGPWGAIGVHCRARRTFTQDDANVLHAIAHVLGSAIERRQHEAALQSSRDHLEAVVRERTARLEQANRELDAFSSAVSHDLRSPVRAIAGFSALLAHRHAGRLDPRGREMLEEIRRAAARMGNLIEDLLDLSRADRAPETLVRVPVDVTRLAEEVLRLEAERAPGRDVRWDIEPDLVVHGDPDLLRMALENLLSNAWKFTARAPQGVITVSKRREGEDIVLCVQDNGAGFDMADAGRLFQPFQRLHAQAEYDGTGIGLATVRRIVERHGGRVWAQGRPGQGAAFYVAFPSSGNRPA